MSEEKREARQGPVRTVPPQGEVVWKGRPSVGVFAYLYGALALVAMLLLVGIEYWATYYAHVLPEGLSSAAPGSLFPYALETLTVLVIALIYLGELVSLAFVRARNNYVLRTDGLYFNTGIANLESTFLSPMAFSDARLVRTVWMRLVGRGLIIVEANDRRRFEMRLIKDPVQVQSLIRNTLSRPTVRLEGVSVAPPPDSYNTTQA